MQKAFKSIQELPQNADEPAGHLALVLKTFIFRSSVGLYLGLGL